MTACDTAAYTFKKARERDEAEKTVEGEEKLWMGGVVACRGGRVAPIESSRLWCRSLTERGNKLWLVRHMESIFRDFSILRIDQLCVVQPTLRTISSLTFRAFPNDLPQVVGGLPQINLYARRSRVRVLERLPACLGC